MIHGAPRSVADIARIIASEMGVTVGYARTFVNRLPQFAGQLDEIDARLRANAALADLEAARSLTERDIQELADDDDPEAGLDFLISMRSYSLQNYGSL